MADQQFTLDREAALRVSKAVRRVEKMGGKLPDPAGQSGQSMQRVGLVKVTSTTATAGLYPGVQWVDTQAAVSDPQAPTTSNSYPPGYVVPAANQYGNAAQDCWVAFNSGAVPSVGQVYPGVASRLNTDGLPVYRVGGAGGDSDQWVKVTNTTTTAVNIVGGSVQQCYPALLQTVPGGGFVDSTAAWFVMPNGPPPAVNDRYYCPQIGVESISGTPVYAIGESSLFGWSTEVITPTTFITTSTAPVDSGAAVTLPYVGAYLIIVKVPGQLVSNQPIPSRPQGTTLYAQLYDAGAATMIGGELAVVSFPQELFPNSVLVDVQGSCTLAAVYNNTTAGNVVKIYCWVANLQDGSATLGKATFDVVLLSTGTLPSATTVNGQTGGVVIAGGTSGGQSPTGVGATVATSSGTVSVGLSPAAAASINQSLASNNV